MNKILKKNYYQNEFQNCGDIKKNWKVLSKLIPKKNKTENNDIKLTMGNEQIPTKQIADVLNKAFNEVGLRLQTPSGNTSVDALIVCKHYLYPNVNLNSVK